MLALGFGLVWPNQARRKILQFLSLSFFGWLCMIQILTHFYWQLLRESERLRMKKLEELNKTIESLY
jgi:hypothetical protein